MIDWNEALGAAKKDREDADKRIARAEAMLDARVRTAYEGYRKSYGGTTQWENLSHKEHWRAAIKALDAFDDNPARIADDKF